MASSSLSIAEELLGHIPILNAFQIRPLVPYLSPEDATTIENFKNSELADDYYIETINLRYGKLENKNHLFDVFANYCGYEESTYIRLDMLKFVADNSARYEWDAHVLLKMHGSNLARWTANMTDVLNKGDELAIYAMCDMLKRHAFVYTCTKPWTTVDSNVGKLNIAELCMLCDVCLIYLGNNRYGELKCKPEILSPLPRLLPVKHESPKTLENMDQTALSPTKELVVRVLDANQSSCTLLTLPCSPTMSQLEDAKKLMSLKPDVATNVETCEPSVIETSLVQTQPDVSTDNPASLSMDTLNPEKDLSVSESNNNETVEKNQVNDSATNQTHATEDTLDDKPAETAQDTTQPADANNVDKPTSPSTTQLEIKITNNDCGSKETEALTALPLSTEKVSSATPSPQKPTSSSTATSTPLQALTDEKDT